MRRPQALGAILARRRQKLKENGVFVSWAADIWT